MNSEKLKLELQSKSVDELKTLARNAEMKGFSGLKKDELIDSLLANESFVSAYRKGWLGNLIGKHHHHFYGGTALVLEIAAVVIALVSLIVFWPRSSDANTNDAERVDDKNKQSALVTKVEYTNQKPKIVGIYPNDTFGPFRKAGLHAIVDNYPEIKLVDLDSVSTAEMKRNEVAEVVEQLEQLISNDNVVAIVGPPVSECTKSILDAVAKTNPNIPVFLESAIGKSHLGWSEYRDELKIYRISSGIDRRATEVSRLLGEFANEGKKVKICVERDSGTVDPSYGEYMLEAVRYMYPRWEQDLAKGSIDITYYPSTDLQAAVSVVSKNSRNADLLLVFGLGDHYRAFADALYKNEPESNSSFHQPPMLGIMIGYALQPKKVSAELASEKLFEITDFAFDVSGPAPECYTQFFTHFGKPNPANRDQAYSYDAGFCILSSLERLKNQQKDIPRGKYIFMNASMLGHLSNDFESNVFSGVTGEIKFGNDGQNVGNRLIYARVNPETQSWATAKYNDIKVE